ncbi:MAG: hypothetical protein KGQ36_03630 [Rickettsiales bacterium]|nr:hypothetical protein [Rickettsiales bacterium]
MQKVTGIKSVDFKVIAKGYGVVNWNGPTTLQSDGRIIDNHSMPKLRGYSNLTGKESEKGYKLKKDPSEINFKETPLYISQNCIRHHLFKENSYVKLKGLKNDEMTKYLCSIAGLVRGYVGGPNNLYKRTSPLLLEDFIDQIGAGNFEQFGKCGSKDKDKDDKGDDVASNTFFSKTTFGDTLYEAYGSISIEQLQFVSLDNKFDRAAMVIKDNEGEKVAAEIEKFIKSLDPSRNPKAIFHQNYVRNGTIFEEGEVGVLLDNEAINILVKETIHMIQDLVIRQAKGYMYVDAVEVDYNDSNKMMRIKRDKNSIASEPKTSYASYFYAK